MNVLRETWIVFHRAMRLSLRNPMWSILMLSQPLMYLFLFGPLLKPITAHADTQGQGFPVFVFVLLLGFDLMPRNWKDLIFYWPGKQTQYTHIDALSGETGRNVIDFELIESQFGT